MPYERIPCHIGDIGSYQGFHEHLSCGPVGTQVPWTYCSRHYSCVMHYLPGISSNALTGGMLAQTTLSMWSIGVFSPRQNMSFICVLVIEPLCTMWAKASICSFVIFFRQGETRFGPVDFVTHETLVDLWNMFPTETHEVWTFLIAFL